MGFAKEIARRGAVGGTARWGATIYSAYSSNNQLGKINSQEELTHEINNLVKYALQVRFNGDITCQDASSIWDSYNTNGKTFGFSGFVVSVLAIEAGFYKNTRENISMFTEIIEEELEKAGVPPSVIYGNKDLKPVSSLKENTYQPDSVNRSNSSSQNSPWIWLACAIVILFILKNFR